MKASMQQIVLAVVDKLQENGVKLPAGRSLLIKKIASELEPEAESLLRVESRVYKERQSC